MPQNMEFFLQAYADLFPGSRLKRVVFRDASYDIQSDALILYGHLDEVVRLELLGQIVTSLLQNLGEGVSRADIVASQPHLSDCARLRWLVLIDLSLRKPPTRRRLPAFYQHALTIKAT